MDTIILHLYNSETITVRGDTKTVLGILDCIKKNDEIEYLLVGEDNMGAPTITKIRGKDIDYIEIL